MYSVLRAVLHDTLDYSTAPFSRVTGQLDHLSPIARFNLRFPCCCCYFSPITDIKSTEKTVKARTYPEDGYVNDFPLRYVFVDAQDIFEWRSWKLLSSSLNNQDTTSALIGQKQSLIALVNPWKIEVYVIT